MTMSSLQRVHAKDLPDDSRRGPLHIRGQPEEGLLSVALVPGKGIYLTGKHHMPEKIRSSVSEVPYSTAHKVQELPTLVPVIRVTKDSLEERVSRLCTAARSISLLTRHSSGALSLARYAVYHFALIVTPTWKTVRGEGSVW